MLFLKGKRAKEREKSIVTTLRKLSTEFEKPKLTAMKQKITYN